MEQNFRRLLREVFYSDIKDLETRGDALTFTVDGLRHRITQSQAYNIACGGRLGDIDDYCVDTWVEAARRGVL